MLIWRRTAGPDAGTVELEGRLESSDPTDDPGASNDELEGRLDQATWLWHSALATWLGLLGSGDFGELERIST